MPDKSVSCIITDPPFGSATRDWDKEPTAEAWAQMRRVCAGPIAVCGYGKHHLKWARHFDGMDCLAYIVWHKYNEPVVSPSLTRVHQDWVVWGTSQNQIDATAVREPYSNNIFLKEWFNTPDKNGKSQLATNKHKMAQKCHEDGRRCSDVWSIAVENAGFHGAKRLHPNCKPQELMRRLVLILTKPGDTILDPYAGSGSTLLAAKEMGRGYIGIELQPEYVAVCKHRLEIEYLSL
jgi:DNA modification methylase